MIVILYRWKIKPEKAKQFIDSWTEITSVLRRDHGSLGSRLHLGDDGLYYGYAQWTSMAERETAFGNIVGIKAREEMLDAIDETLPLIILDPLCDLLITNLD